MAILLPANGYFTSGIDNGQAKAAQNDQLAFLRQSVVGGAEITNNVIEISGGSVTTVNAVHAIDTEGQSAADDLDRFDFTNIQDGQVIYVRCVDGSRVVTAKHAAGGVGQSFLHGSADFVMDDTGKWLALRREGDGLFEMWRSWGADTAGAQAFIGLGDIAPLNAGDGLTPAGPQLDVQLDGAQSGLSLSSSGLSLDLIALAAGSPAPVDFTAVEKSTGGTVNMTLAKWLEVINGLTEETAPNVDADFLVVYNAAAAAARKVLPSNIASNFIKAWAYWNGTGTVAAINGSGVSSVGDLGEGNYRVNFSTPFPNANYGVVGLAVSQNPPAQGQTFNFETSKTTTYCDFITHRDGTTLIDTPLASAAFLDI